jgi:hypothetical protein
MKKYNWKPAKHFVGYHIEEASYFAVLKMEFIGKYRRMVWTYEVRPYNENIDFLEGLSYSFTEAQSLCEQFLNDLKW